MKTLDIPHPHLREEVMMVEHAMVGIGIFRILVIEGLIVDLIGTQGIEGIRVIEGKQWMSPLRDMGPTGAIPDMGIVSKNLLSLCTFYTISITYFISS